MPRGGGGGGGKDEPVRSLRGRDIPAQQNEATAAGDRPRVTETNEQNICRQCNKWFASTASLEAHKRTHVGSNKQSESSPAGKRRAVAPATSSNDSKRARGSGQSEATTTAAAAADTDSEGVATRSGGVGYSRILRCKICDAEFNDKPAFTAHMHDEHPEKTSTPTSTPMEKSRVTRQSTAGGSATIPSPPPASTPPARGRVAKRTEERPPTPESPLSPSSAATRSRNTTLRFEEELGDGNVQCRQCQQVFNNRRGLAAHVAQKHREELDTEQRTIEEDRLRADDVFFRRRAAQRIASGTATPMLTPQSRPISILTRRTPGSASGQQSMSQPRSAVRPSVLSSTATPVSSGMYPRRATLEILTQPSPIAQMAAAQSQAPRILSSEFAVRTAENAKKAAAASVLDEQPMGAYTEPMERQRKQTSESPSKRAAAAAAAAPPPISEVDNEDDLDESAYEFSTEVNMEPAGDIPMNKSPMRSRGAGVDTMDEPIRSAENFPCKFCKDRIFLTSYGLERHTKMSHPNMLEEVLNDLRRAQLEKARREGGTGDERLYIDEGHRSYERFPHLDARHQVPGLGMTAQGAGYGRRRYGEKENEPNDSEVIQIAREQSAALLAGASFTSGAPFAPRARRSNDVARAKYQSCDICGILINTEHPKALESHTKAHQKNQELRHELLRTCGAAWVERVTCRECNLVFKDEDKLEQHRRNVHVRRRHFLCRFCGDVFRNMRDLNAHKERRHEAFEGHRRGGETSPPATRRPMTGGNGGFERATTEEFSCRTTCEVCGVQMPRPSNLIRHMKVSHNRTNFTATVETRGMPPFKIDVNEGRFMWGCCDEVFDDRQAFINHRRVAHGPSYMGAPKECEHCGLMFKSSISYMNHLRTHRTRVCTICSETFGNSVSDLNAFRAHMIRHRDQGYSIRLPAIDEELATKEQQELWRAINEEEEDGSEDEYSVFSESGVESDVDEDSSSDDDAPADQMTCPMCEKTFSCIYRYSDHWNLHCRQPFRDGTNLKTKPFSYKIRRTAAHKFKCGFCNRKYKTGSMLAAHSLSCRKQRMGILPKEEDVDASILSGGSSRTSSPTKASPKKKNVGGQQQQAAKATEEKRKGKGSTQGGADREESLKELEDQLDIRPKKKKYVPEFVEKAYVVEWDTSKPPSDKPYLCQKCNESFTDFLTLIMHVKTHVAHPISEYEEVETKATMAAAKSTTDKNGEDKKVKDDKVTVSVLRIRTSTTEALGKHACQVCGRCFHDSKDLKSHLDEKHRPHKHFRCRLCRRRFWTNGGLQRHERRRHNASGLYNYCGTCGKRFVTVEALNNHEQIHELSTSLYQCEDCTVSFYGLNQLKQHFKDHHQSVSIMSCPICARILTDAKSLNDHFDTDHPNVRTLCRVCNKVFHTPAEARCHRRRVHMPVTGGTVDCSLCAKKFTDKRQLSVHLWRHQSTKSYQCGICDRPFDNDEAVRTHLEYEHEIDWLNSRDLIVQNTVVFGGSTDDEEETTTTTAAAGRDERRFSCHVCEKKFKSKAAVKEHAYGGAHNRVKNHECPKCKTKFWKPWALADHIRRQHEAQGGDAGEEKEAEGTISADMAQLLLNQGRLQFVGDNVQMLVADDATAAAVMAATGGGQDYQVLLVQNENGETVQFALGPQAQRELAQMGQQSSAENQRSSNQGDVEGQPMQIDESNYQQFLNQ